MLPKRPVVAAFTATATDKVCEDITIQLGMREPLRIITGFDRKNLFFSVVKTNERMEYVREYVRRHTGQSGIVYAATRKNVEEICAMLCEDGVSATQYHAGLPDRKRWQNQEDFIFDRKPVIVATNAFGMGIDKSNVSFVIHYNTPLNLEEYYQQAGRAGRDGEPAECILLYSGSDVRLGRFLIDRSLETATELDDKTRELLREREYEKLKQMTFYATSKYCLRRNILSYFGERHPRICQNCSNCIANTKQATHVANEPEKAKTVGTLDETLFNHLKVLRKKLADEQNVPAFVVFSDAVLRAIASSKPRTLERTKAASTNYRKPKSEFVAPQTIEKIHKLLACAFKQAVRWEIIAKNPFELAIAPKTKYQKRDIWTAEMICKALDACRDSSCTSL